jgi:hypothetical protein
MNLLFLYRMSQRPIGLLGNDSYSIMRESVQRVHAKVFLMMIQTLQLEARVAAEVAAF